MDNTEFKKIVQGSTSKYGFMYCKKNYYCETDDVIVVVNLQKSNYSNRYYINYGFYVKEIHNELQYPRLNECDVTGRFINRTSKDAYQLDIINADELVAELEKNINNYIVPVINDGINKYFVLFPNAICRATLNLKEFLKVN